MNRVESETRALRYLAIIQQQLRLASAHDVYQPIYSETVVQDSMNARFKLGLRNLNVDQLNFPAIDLRTKDRKHGIQATRKATAAKYKHTLAAMRTEMEQPGNRLKDLVEVQIVGIECVTNRALQTWHVPEGVAGARVRMICLDKVLRLKEAKTKRLGKVENVLHGLSSSVGPQLRGDRDEIVSIAAFVDRPAIRDSRKVEGDWEEMDQAMKDIRRLLSLGTTPAGVTTTRGWQTFQPPVSAMLKTAYDASAQISRLLRDEVRAPGSLTQAQERLIDGHRLTIQEQVTLACRHLSIAPPVW